MKKYHQCAYCEKTRDFFPNDEAYYSHSCRNRDEVFCKYCEVCFASNKILMKHVDSCHKGIKYFCEKCNKTLSSYSALKRHENAHEKKNSYSCNDCGKTFERKYNFQRHISSCLKKYSKNNKSKVQIQI